MSSSEEGGGREGGEVGGAYRGLHNGSARREREAAQATRSPFPSGSRAQQGMRADALLMLSSCQSVLDRSQLSAGVATTLLLLLLLSR